MLQHFFKMALRGLRQNKSFSFLNVAGHSTGMAVAMLIGLWVWNEWTYDHFHANADRIYQVKMTDMVNGEKQTWQSVPLPMAEALPKSFPEVKRTAEMDWGGGHGLKNGDKVFVKDGYQVGPDFLEIFTFPMLAGDQATALRKPNSIVLTAETGEAVFGHSNYGDMVGKPLKVDNFFDMTVTGIVENPPKNSSLRFHLLMPFSTWETQDWVKQSRTNWGNNSFQVFMELQPGVDGAVFAKKIKGLVQQNNKESKADVTLHACKDWHLFDKFENGKVAGGSIEMVRLFGLIGLIVLVIACINFMNLSTARSERRSKEVGVRKTLGSSRGALIGQYLGEAMFLSFLAFGLSLLLVKLTLPSFNQLAGGSLEMPLGNPVFWAVSLGFTLLAGLLAGSYPAFFLSSFKPIQVLKGNAGTVGIGGVGKAALLPRKVLVVSQFAISTALIISTLVVHRQIEHGKDRPKGYNPEQVVMVPMSGDLVDNFDPLKNKLLASGKVSGVTKASSPVTAVFANMKDVTWKGKDPADDAMFATVATSEDYFTTLGMELVQGRFFDAKLHPSDTMGVIFSEAAIQRMGLENPLEETITWNEQKLQIVGVVKDVVMTNPFGKAGPAMYLYSPTWVSHMMFRLTGDEPQAALTVLEPIFKKHNPAYSFDYSFADEEYGRKFNMAETVGKLSALFAGLAIFISCLGLFGLAAYMAERRTKEIGIRKVLGASTANLWALLSKEFVALVAIGCILAMPLAAYITKGWLEKFEYRIELSWAMFALAAVAAIAVTLLTVSFQSVKAALANPVKSLRSE
jgi:ABC-type antimicrobial peptide transport system permease subunit